MKQFITAILLALIVTLVIAEVE